MRFSADFLDELRSRISLIDLIGSNLSLRKRGNYFVALCPFHREKTPSFTITPDGSHYHCFGCGAHGSHFQYLMEIEHLTFRESVEKCAHMAGISIPRQHESEEESKFFEELYKANHDAARFFTQQLYLPKNEAILSYCTKRGLTKETIGYFALGYAPDDWHGLKNHLLAKGYALDLLLKAGLLTQNEEKKVTYDRFRGRLIFPIFDHQERIVAFGGRSLFEQEPKYLNSPETLLFKKGEILYNRSNARRHIKDHKTIIVVEGYMDAITLHQYGFPNAVAPLGTAFTSDHLKALWRFCPEPIFCFDGDEAGQKAHLRVIDIALPHLVAGKSAQFLILPEGEDPDSFLRKFGAEQFQKLCDHPEPLFQKLIEYEKKLNPSDTPERRALLISKLQEKGKLIQDQLVQQCYYDLLREQFGMAETAYKTFSKPSRTVAPKPNDPSLFCSRQESALLLMLIENPTLLDACFEQISDIQFKDQDLEQIRNLLVAYVTENLPLEKSEVITYLEKTPLASQARRIEMDPNLKILFPMLRKETKMEQKHEQWLDLFQRYKSSHLNINNKPKEEDLLSEEGWSQFLKSRQAEFSE